MKRCAKCILPDSYPGIHFNNLGVCNFCLDENPANIILGEDKLIRLLGSLHNKRSKYDCIVPVSGGKESTYILYYAVRKLNLRCLAVNYNSGFQSEIALGNIQNACRILGVPLVVVKPDMRIQKNMLKAALAISGIVKSFSRTCMNCGELLKAVSVNTARKYDTPVVLWGASSFEISDGEIINAGRKQRLSRVNVTTILKSIPYVIKYAFYSVYQRLSFRISLLYALNPIGISPLPKNKPKFIHFFDYIDYKYDVMVRVLEDVMGWRYPDKKEIRFDCLLHCFSNHRSLQSFGISSDAIIFCNYIRKGFMKREEALSRENKLNEKIYEECTEIIKTLKMRNFNIPELEGENKKYRLL